MRAARWLSWLLLSLAAVTGCRDPAPAEAPREQPAPASTARPQAPTPIAATIPPPARELERPAREAAPPPTRAEAPPAESPSPKTARGPPKQVLDDVTVLAWGKPIHRGRVDLRPTIARILRGARHRHRNDGAVFGNRERRLPKQRRGYYREYVHPTPSLRGAGPQRVIAGRGGDWYYTPDHYETFVPLQ